MRYVAAAIAMTCFAAFAYADETPTKEQTAKVEATLKAEGFAKWERIELDKGHFEVDDAVDASGKQYDLRIDAQTMKITSKIAD